MLHTSAPSAFIATAMPDRTRASYADTLGLHLLTNDDFSLATKVFARGCFELYQLTFFADHRPALCSLSPVADSGWITGGT